MILVVAYRAADAVGKYPARVVVNFPTGYDNLKNFVACFL
jgi:hypothetical protein